MKYLKITMSLFAVALVFSIFNAQAQVVYLEDITIPIFSGVVTAKSAAKTGFNTQYIKKTKCTDDISGDGRVINAGLHLTTGNGNPNNDPSWVEAKPNQNVAFNSKSTQAGGWELYLASNKSLVTTASFWGQWTVD